MTDPFLVGSIFKGAKEVLDSLSSADEANLDRRYRTENDRVVDALNSIYFTPDGVRGLLEKLSRSEPLDPSEVTSVLGSFNDGEWRVEAALHDIDSPTLWGRRELSIEAKEHLRLASYGKISVRRKLQERLNEALTYGDPISADEAKALLAEVEALNEKLSMLEKTHNYRARGR